MTTTHLPGKARRGIALAPDQYGVDGVRNRNLRGHYSKGAAATRPAKSRKNRRTR